MVTLINPNLLVQRNDMFTTGIVYMPFGLAYFAASLEKNGFECKVIDAFGQEPNQCWFDDDFLVRGLKPEQVLERIPLDTEIIVIYAINAASHSSLIQIIQTIRPKFSIPIIVMENSQAVTAYSLRRIQNELYDLGVDFIITGEAEDRGIELMRLLKNSAHKDEISKVDGIGFKEEGIVYYTNPQKKINDLDSLAFPAWDLFPLENYWKLGYAHGPLQAKKYLPLLTSRGCPYSCQFCVASETNDSLWRSRSPENIINEMQIFLKKFGVCEFHIEDLNPTVDDKRIRNFCKEIIKRNLKVNWKISSGTKVETIHNEDTIELMAKAGCSYISISPESGSSRVLKMANKSFNFDHAYKLIKKMNKVGIRSQACFVLGYPGEEDKDRQLTWELVRDFTKAGIDEIAIFIIAPLPGAPIFNELKGYTDYSQLTFSPRWRDDYKKLSRFRFRLYKNFILWKLFYHPIKLARQPINFLMRRFETKMEMVPYRALHTTFMSLANNERSTNYEN